MVNLNSNKVNFCLNNHETYVNNKFVFKIVRIKNLKYQYLTIVFLITQLPFKIIYLATPKFIFI